MVRRAVKNSSFEDILMIMLAQLKENLREYMKILNIMNITKREKKS
jgi:hypothetical protein